MVDVPLGRVPALTDHGGQGGRSYGGRQERRPAAPGRLRNGADDRVQVHAGAAVALQILRERVLAATRTRLGLEPVHAVRTSLDDEGPQSVAGFLSRLLSEQNQLAARAAGMVPAHVRQAVVEGLQAGAADALDVLEATGRFEAGSVQLVVAVLAEFGQRLAALAAVADDSR